MTRNVAQPRARREEVGVEEVGPLVQDPGVGVGVAHAETEVLGDLAREVELEALAPDVAEVHLREEVARRVDFEHVLLVGTVDRERAAQPAVQGVELDPELEVPGLLRVDLLAVRVRQAAGGRRR